MSSYLARTCPECHEPIDIEDDTFITTVKENHAPNTPGMPPERHQVNYLDLLSRTDRSGFLEEKGVLPSISDKNLRMPNCGHSPLDE